MEISLADAKDRLNEIIDLAGTGETVTITREGTPVAILSAAPVPPAPRKPIDFDAMRALTDSMPYRGTSAADFIREMRDSDRY